MILRTATTLGLLAALSLATDSPALAQPEAPAPTLQIQPATPAPAATENPVQAEPKEVAEPAKTAEPAVVIAPAKQEEPPVPAIPPAPPMPSVAPNVPPVQVAPGIPHSEVAPVEEEWHIAIVPLGGCWPPAPAQAGAPDIRYYREVYESIPFSRAEFEANPSYRHDATLEILFGYMRPTTIVRGPANVGTSLYYPIQSPPVVANPAWSPHGGNFGRLVPWNRFGNRRYYNWGFGPFYP